MRSGDDRVMPDAPASAQPKALVRESTNRREANALHHGDPSKLVTAARHPQIIGISETGPAFVLSRTFASLGAA